MQIQNSQALRRMEEITGAGLTFEVAFYKYSKTTGDGGDFVRRGNQMYKGVYKGLLRLEDAANGERIQVHCPLLVELNSNKIALE